MTITTRTSSPHPTRSSRRRRAGSAPSAAISTRATHCPPTSSAPFASTARRCSCHSAPPRKRKNRSRTSKPRLRTSPNRRKPPSRRRKRALSAASADLSWRATRCRTTTSARFAAIQRARSSQSSKTKQRYHTTTEPRLRLFLRVLRYSFYTLMRNSVTSPSCITYSLPSSRTSPLSRAAALLPHSTRSL